METGEQAQVGQTMPPRTGMDLSDRQRIVLRAVVEDYVTSAAPVGSKALISRRGMAVSSATIRGTMAELESLGLLSHPAHERRARAVGPRAIAYYVETLMHESELDRADRLMIRHQFSQVQLTSNEWLRLAASILAAAPAVPRWSRRHGPARALRPSPARRAGRRQSRLCVLVHADGNVASDASTVPRSTARSAGAAVGPA